MINIQSVVGGLLVTTLFLSSTASCGGKRNDDVIAKEVNDTLKARGSNYSNVTAQVSGGHVILTGSCQGENCPDSVSRWIANIRGVADVDNSVEQQPTATDLTLRTSVQTIVSKYQGVQADVVNSVIVLRGLIPRDQVQPLMNELEDLRPRKIDNQLAVR